MQHVINCATLRFNKAHYCEILSARAIATVVFQRELFGQLNNTRINVANVLPVICDTIGKIKMLHTFYIQHIFPISKISKVKKNILFIIVLKKHLL